MKSWCVFIKIKKMVEIDLHISHFKYFLICLIFNLFLFNHSAYSQGYHVRTYTDDDGLANAKVFDITQDNSGCMWFATRTGISMYDGKRWKTYSYNDGLPATEYSNIKCDRQGTVWALSSFSNIIAHFNGQRWHLLPQLMFPRHPHHHKFISSFEVVTINNQTVVAVGTRGLGLYLWTENKWKHINAQKGLIDPSINDIAAYGEGFYIATDSGLSVLIPGTEIIDNTINQGLELPSPEVIGIAIEKTNDTIALLNENIITWLMGKEWIGYLKNGVFTAAASSIALPRNDFEVFLQPDYQRGIFFGNKHSVFYIEKNSRLIQHFGKKQGLISEGASDVYVDREKNIWFSSFRGVSKIASMRFITYRQSHGLLSDETTAAWEIEPGSMVFGHNEGITFFKDNQFRRMDFSGKAIKNNTYVRVMDIKSDRRGNIWIAAPDLGLAKMNKNYSIQWYSTKQGLPPRVTSVLIDASGNVWAGAPDGVFILQGTLFARIEPENITVPIYARKLFLGPDNSVYVATPEDGIYVIKKNKWEPFFHTKDEYANSVYTMLIDRRGNAWIGSRGGLYILEGDTPLKYKKEGFRINHPIYFIVEDHRDHLWFGTDNGVVKWDGEQWKEYTVQQGLAGKETNRAAGFVDSKGRVWIGTEKGINCYREEFEKKEIPPPLVEILSLNVSGREMPVQKVNKLKHDMNHLVFHFRAVSFIDEDAVRFRTKLEGFDPGWSSASASNDGQIRYTNLLPGRYKFYLKAKNAEGIWSEVVSSADIIIQKPFWNEWWFYIILLIILGGGFYGIQDYFSKKRYASLLEKQVYEKTVKLKKSEQEYRGLYENAHDAILIITPGEEKILEANQRACELYGFDRSEFIGMSLESISKDKIKGKQEIKKTMEAGKYHNFETVQYRKNRTEMFLEINASIVDFKGQKAILSINRDITERKRSEAELKKYHLHLEDMVKKRTAELTEANIQLKKEINERKQAEEQIKASLEEKEVLLKEIHHRVKNNLQIISSLLDLQSGYINDKKTLDVLKNSRERVYAMALTHEKLYESKDLSKIDFREYIHSLIIHLFDSYSLKTGQVQLKMQIEDVVLDIETAIPLGLIINELVSNSLKHAFPAGRNGELQVILGKSEDKEYDYILIAGDNGIGFPDHLDFQHSNSLGMVLVHSLVKKLKGVIDLERKDGTRFTIKFKKSKYKKRI